MSLKRKPLKTLKNIRENAEADLPTHASDAGVEIPDSLAHKGARTVKPALDGKAVAAASGQKGSHQGNASADLPTHASNAAVQIPEEEDMDDEKALDEVYGDEDEKEVKEEDEKDEDELTEEEEKDEKDEDELTEEEEKDEDELTEEEEKELEDEDDAELKKHVEALTCEEDLPESFKQKAAAIFEAAVKATAKRRTDLFRQKLSELYKKKISKKSKNISEQLVTKVDGYLDYVVEEWITENEVAIENSLKTEIVEKFVHGLKGLFETHYIEVPATKTNVLAEQARKIDGLEKELNESLNKNVEFRKKLVSLEKQSVIKKLSEGLTVSEAGKFAELCEGVSYEDAKAFSGKLNIVKETYFPKTSKRTGDLDNELLTEGGIQEQVSKTSRDEIDMAVDTISRMVKK